MNCASGPTLARLATVVALVSVSTTMIGAGTAAAAAQPPRCRAAQLRFEQYGSPSGLVANSAGLFAFTNRSHSPCQLEGYPTFTAYGLTDVTVAQHATDGGDYLYPNPPRRAVTLGPRQSAYFAVGWTRGGPTADCLGAPTATATQMIAKAVPPGQGTALSASFHTFQDYCGPIAISALAPLSAFRHATAG